MASHIDTVLKAIRGRRMITFVYKGQTRTVEPYIIGYDNKDDLILSAAQVSGGSGAGFRTYRMEGVSALQITDRIFFRIHPDYNPRDAYFFRVLGKV